MNLAVCVRAVHARHTDHGSNAVPVLIVQAAGDINATLELGQAMHRALSSSIMVTLDGVRTHGVYLFNGNACVDDAVNGYLIAGTLPAGDLTCIR